MDKRAHDKHLVTDINDAANSKALRKRIAPWLLGGLVLVLLTVLVAAQALQVWTVVTPDTASDTLLLYALSSLIFVAFVVFAFIFLRILLKLRRERREHSPGSKIKTRLIVYFIALSLLPITAMAVFSYLFINRSLEKWFNRVPESVVKEIVAVQQQTVLNQAQNLRATASMLANVLDQNFDPREDAPLLEKIVASGHLTAVEIISSRGEQLARSEPLNLSPSARDELNRTLGAARNASSETNTSLIDDKGFDAVSVPLGADRKLIVVRAGSNAPNLNDLLAGPNSEYSKLVARQHRVRQLGLSTLGLFTLLQLFAVTWIAIHLARGIATPIKALAEAADEVARGNLAHRVNTIAEDELALLADSFNAMTAQLAENRQRIEAGAAELRDKNLALEERRNYIEIVLEALSTGVISLDENDMVTTINPAAAQMLQVPEAARANFTLAQITCAEDYNMLDRLLRRARRTGRAAEQVELGRNASQESAVVPVALTASALPARSGEGYGVVLVMEDLTELLSAQRAAAWSEVARRMAHEIKNPLTPIQLSAERIAKSFAASSYTTSQAVANGNGGLPSGVGNGDALSVDAASRERVAKIVGECTATITREVAGLKAMVDEFSRFARLPHARLEAADLNEVVRQSVALYEGRLEDIRMDVRLARWLPTAMLDAEQLRRVFVNLIDNALESLAEIEGERRITIATAHDPSRGLLLTEVADTGQGIARADFSRLFQPYFSTRERGTGLGLAIIQRIITDHGGRIRVEANRPRGAKFTIELPIASG
jgi:two-component system nitrogen regulation sensor histidine kinase NtrY